MRAVSEWFWVIAGIFAGLIIFSIAIFQVSQMNLSIAEQKSLESFEELKNKINNLCWSFSYNKREHILLLSENIEGVYVFESKKEFSSEELKSLILNKEISKGDFLCIKIKGKRLKCERLECNSSMPFLGYISESPSLSALINKVIKGVSVSENRLLLEREEERVNITLIGK